MVEAGGERSGLVADLSPPGNRDQGHRSAGRRPTDLTGDFVSVQSRHFDIEDGYFRRPGFEGGHRLRAIMHNPDLVPVQAHQDAKALGRVLVIVGYEYIQEADRGGGTAPSVLRPSGDQVSRGYGQAG